ncbi:MAG: type III-A CRISPR-associated protein Csm2 [Firmicutes bacterium]|nr:type III-A CRISPR-associated protein Csm2 [Bacillota bacterium]MCL5063952.1 type III-A CRISPR-associated protein Csm2 [Bacillota bacterium]
MAPVPVTRSNYLTDPDGYLLPSGGYRPAIYLEEAQFVVDNLKHRTTPHALRRFFNRVKAIERSMDGGRHFEAKKSELYSLIPQAHYAVKRQLAQEFFSMFIERNVAEAIQSWEQFQGFVKHFESVVAYFPTENEPTAPNRGGSHHARPQ